MTLWRSNPDQAADALITAARPDLNLTPPARLLLVNQSGTLPESLRAEGFELSVWNRRLAARFSATATPPDGPFDTALIRIPKSKAELLMLAQQASTRLQSSGRLIVYGGNDEGIKTVGKRLEPLLAETITVSTRGHGRVLAIRPSTVPRTPSQTLATWRQSTSLIIGHSPARAWVTYPGLFAGGTLDPGTALLLAHLPTLKVGAAILDFGCGTGPIAHSLHDRDAASQIDMLDNDAIALVAAAENVPSARPVLGRDLTAVAGRRYDLIISNPPIHDGIREDHTFLEQLITDAPTHLNPGATLLLVVQRRIPLDKLLAKNFAHIGTPIDDGRFRVWSATL